MDLEKLKQEIKELFDKLNQKFITQQTELKEHGTLNATVSEDMKTLKEQYDAKNTELEAKLKAHEEKLIELSRIPAPAQPAGKETFGFANLGEFILAAVKNSKSNPHDDRLKKVNDYMAEQEMISEGASKGFVVPPALSGFMGRKELSAGVGEEGGYLIRPQFGPMLRMFEAQPGIFRPRATVVPAGTPPDSEITFPALDQSSDLGVYSGVEVKWLNEGGTKDQTDFKTRDITLKPQEVAAFIRATDKLLRNAPAASSLIESLLRKATIAAEDQAFYNGAGTGLPLGILGHGSTIEIPRAVANQVAWEDIVNMYARIVFGGNYIFLINQTVLPQLMQMEDGGGNLIWMPNKDAITTMPGTLLGIPVVVNQRSTTLGNTGDIGLLDLSYYYIKDGSGPIIASSEHVYFTSNKTVVKITWNVDGQPSITTPLTLEDGTETASPFVFLDDVISS